MAITITAATAEQAARLADLAAQTFPLACPASAAAADISAFIDANLSEHRFAGYLNDPDRVVLVATDEDRTVGYAMVIRGVGDDPDVAACVPDRPAAELSKIYVLPSHHGTGAAAALLNAGLDWADRHDARAVWLGVNQNNQRAQRFYRKHGFRIAGARRFRLGSAVEEDFVMVHAGA